MIQYYFFLKLILQNVRTAFARHEICFNKELKIEKNIFIFSIQVDFPAGYSSKMYKTLNPEYENKINVCTRKCCVCVSV